MKKQDMSVPSKSYQRGINSLKIHIALLAVLAAGIANSPAQGLPPIPDLPPYVPPHEQTPEELAAQRKAQEEVWRKNRETVLPYLQSAPAADPVDLIKQQRLISAELLEREHRKAAVERRKTDILNWADKVGKEQRASKVRAEKRAKELGYKIRHESRDPSDVEVDMVGDRLVFQTSYNINAAKTISTDKARTNAPAGWGLNGYGVQLGLWDGGVIGTNHVEFTTGGFDRVVWLDDTNMFDPTGHPTFMAGNMVAAGVNPLARGMASDAQVLAFNRNKDYEEMATNSVTRDLRLSNHSYGYRMGWDSGVLVGRFQHGRRCVV